MDISYGILKLRFNPTDIASKEVYYQIKDEDNYGHMALICDYYTNGNRTIVIMYDDEIDKSWIVAEFTDNDKCVASEFFNDYKSARKFFKEII